MEVAFYRIVQEALTNVVKHSRATSVWISIKSEDSLVVVTIKDNGCGFNMDEIMKSEERGLGLFGMKERMSTIGGELKIHTTPGQGTEIVAKSLIRRG
jgi:signal transduction histidine kinase